MGIRIVRKKRAIVKIGQIIEKLGNNESLIETGNPQADMIIGKMEELSDKAMKKFDDFLLRKNNVRKNSCPKL